MKLKNKGFVMIETIVVITVLAVGLITLYASYSLILSRISVKNRYDNTAYVYKTYFVLDYLKKINETNAACYKASGVIDTGCGTSLPAGLSTIMSTFAIEKIYVFPSALTYADLTNASNLNKYDGSTIAYFRSLGGDYQDSQNHIVVKFSEPHPFLTDPNIKLTNFASLEYDE